MFSFRSLVTAAACFSLAAGSPIERDLQARSAMTCKADYPSNKICNFKGHATKSYPNALIGTSQLNFQDCTNACITSNTCLGFYWRDGTCALYQRSLSDLALEKFDDAGYWYAAACFTCAKGDEILHLDFEDKNVDQWTLDNNDDFMFDVQLSKTLGGLTSAFRFLEATQSGTGRAEYMAPIQLEERESYMLYLTVKTTGQRTASLNPWQGVTIALSNSNEDIFKERLGAGSPLGDSGFGQVSTQFDVQDGQGGPATLSFTIQSSGYLLDFFFDDIIIVKL